MSDILGNGYASSHGSYICDAFFVHDKALDIFEALRAASLDSSMNPFPEVCKGVNIK
jgi:hypothetical protein